MYIIYIARDKERGENDISINSSERDCMYSEKYSEGIETV